MNIYYKIAFIGILIYTFIIFKENNDEKYKNLSQKFTLPSVNAQLVRDKQDKADKYSIQQTINTGLGVHDRIRFLMNWD